MIDSNNVLIGARSEIYNIVKDNPGIRFRELARLSNKENGEIQYHIRILIKHNFIKEVKIKGARHFYVSKKYSDNEVKLFILQNSGSIHVFESVKRGNRSYKEISNDLKITPQAVSYHIRRLINNNIIKRESKNKFSINPEFLS